MSVTQADPLARETPAWCDAAKVGIIVHWCPAAIPTYAPLSRDEDLWALRDDADGVGKFWRLLPRAPMYQSTLLIPDSQTARYHAEGYGNMPYDAFVDRFRDEMIPQLDVAAWADTCARSGARYAVVTTKLPDGFVLWPSAHGNARKAGWLSERDVVDEAAAAIRARGLRFALESDAKHLTEAQLNHLFVDIVARGGNLLLDVNPTAGGELPWGEARRLATLGCWLGRHGHAIYGTRPWERAAGINGDGIEVRYTASPDAVHAIVLGTPPQLLPSSSTCGCTRARRPRSAAVEARCRGRRRRRECGSSSRSRLRPSRRSHCASHPRLPSSR